MDMTQDIWAEYLSARVGQRIAVLCARYWYRGTLAAVNHEAILVTDGYAVEETGSATAAAPVQEDKIPGDFLLRVDFVEFVGQPTWADAAGA